MMGSDLAELPSFGRYQPLFKIAAGGMAEVYGARATGEAGFQRWVALKRILPHLSEDQRFVEMFLDEARLAAMVQSVHVVPTLDLGRASDGSLFLVMDLVVGVTLGTMMQGAQRAEELLPIPVVVELVAQSAQGLHDAHEARSQTGEPLHIVHRDVSPRNILVGLDGRARILDFGIAAGELRATQTAIGEIKGTQAYFSPEQAAMQKVDRRSDVYALGIVLWEALVGERLFQKGTTEARDRPERVDVRRPEVGSVLADVVERALVRDREERFQTAEALALALRTAVGASWTSAPTSEVSRLVRVYGAQTIDRIQAGMQRSSSTERPAPSESIPPKQLTGRLRAYGTSFVGREQDLEALESILTSEARLVTLFGPGGMGKTRLAIELAQRVREKFPGGVLFCDLTEARSVEGICYVVGSALGVPSMQATDVGMVVDALGGVLAARGSVLVMLDNLEQTIAHIEATLGLWLRDAPHATFLTTSRERLRLEAETLYELAPLDLDPISSPSGSGEGEAPGTRVIRPAGPRSPAARLFIDRAMRVRRDLKIDADAERAIVAIVRRLDGLPLAIELAASRVRVLEPVQLLAELSERLRTPTRGARDANPRQATLDAAIRWSWDLLDPPEQALFSSLAVFSGGFDARAAAEVAAEGARPADVERVLEQLVDKSLVRLAGGTPPRFAMLESIREFASRELEQRGAMPAAVERHARYYGELAARWDVPKNAVRPADIERDLDNLLQAFRWTADQMRSDEGVHRLLLLALAVEAVLGVRGPVSLVQPILEQAVAACAGSANEADLDARVRLGLARMLVVAGHHDDADRVLVEARRAARRAPDRRAEAWGLLTEAEWQWARGNLREALDASERAAEAGEGVGDVLLLARAYYRQGTVLFLRAEHERAKTALGRARAIAASLRYEDLEARVDVTLADVASDLGDIVGAAKIAKGVVAVALRLSDRWLEARALLTLGLLALEADDAHDALSQLTRAMQLLHESGHVRGEGLFLCFIGVARECVGHVEEARATFEEALAKNQRFGNRLGEGLSHAYLGRLLARRGALQQAQTEVETGARLLQEVGDRVRLVVAMLCGGHVDLAKAERAALQGKADVAETHRARARKLVERTRRELAGGQLRSLDVQHALRMLENDLEGHHDNSLDGVRDTNPPDEPPER